MDNTAGVSIAEIFRQGFADYLQKYGPCAEEHYQVANAIMSCRTEMLGGHVYQCDQCSHEIILYNSCRNRHCPLCQGSARLAWVEKRIDDLLPVGYFHVVFTVPEELRPFFLRNRKPCYSLLFRAVSETLTTLSADPARMGGMAGFIMVLHTWGQNLEFHPHVHCIFAGGVWHDDTQQWKDSNPDFLFPAAVVKRLFKGKLLAFFHEAVKKGEIGFHGQLQQYQDEKVFKKLLSTLYETDPVVYLKEPFATPEQLIQYLGNYTHRVAISQRRILSVENGSVSFSYKDYADNNTQKVMTVSIVEFIRRFLLHVLPSGFMRIRHCGFLSNRQKKKLVPCIRQSIADHSVQGSTTHRECTSIIERVRAEFLLCPHCNQGRLNPRSEISPLWKLVAA